MNLYRYYDNTNGHHADLLAEIYGVNSFEADEEFKRKTNKTPHHPKIGLTIEFHISPPSPSTKPYQPCLALMPVNHAIRPHLPVVGLGLTNIILPEIKFPMPQPSKEELGVLPILSTADGYTPVRK